MNPDDISVADMESMVARFDKLHGSEDAFLDSHLPGARRFKINLIGMGVVENVANPDLRPNIDLPAHGFDLGMIQAEHGNGASLHAHRTEEVFIPLVGPWAVIWRRGMSVEELVLNPFDVIHIPIGVYRGFRYIGEGRGTLLTIIGGPDAGKVTWDESVMDMDQLRPGAPG